MNEKTFYVAEDVLAREYRRVVLVTGFFDMLHSGHVYFLTEAAKLGDLYVCLGNDKNLLLQKNKKPICSENERLFIIKSLRCVKDAMISTKTGCTDFEEAIIKFKPDLFLINDDGNTEEKKKICEKYNIEYRVLLKRGLNPRSSTMMKEKNYMPYSLCLAGGGLDQVYFNSLISGYDITVSLEPIYNFKERSGMATSTRNKAIRLWGSLPEGDEEHIVQILFSYDNLPGTKTFSGTQDSIGICMKGINAAFYKNSLWQNKIIKIRDEKIYDWLEKVIYLVELKPRKKNYNLFKNSKITKDNAKLLSKSSKLCMTALKEMNTKKLGKALTMSCNAYSNAFPESMPNYVKKIINNYKDILGYKLNGAGGGGYLIIVSEKPIENGIRIKIRR